MSVYLKKEKFEELLARKNILQAELARILDIPESYLSTLKDPEKYNLGVSPELREKILKFLEVEFDDIFFIQNSRCSENLSKKVSIISEEQNKGSTGQINAK